MWKQVFAFTDKRAYGEQPDKLLEMREGRDLLRLLTVFETMTNNNKVGFNVDLFCKHHSADCFLFTFDQRKLYKTALFKPKVQGLGNAMNYLKDRVTYYNDWQGRNFPFYKINLFQ